MIQQHIRGPRCGPRIFCEACGKRIGDVRSGVVLWDGRKQNAPPLFVHAGAMRRRSRTCRLPVNRYRCG
jgi:hypothetical protein